MLSIEEITSNMGEISAQAALRNQAGVERFFAGRDALIAQEKQRRSGMCYCSR